jgi:hypothetical protein
MQEIIELWRTYRSNIDINYMLLCGVILSIIIVCSVIFIGYIINKLEQIEMFLLSKWFGYKAANIICNYITFPGIIIHELSHALLAILTGAKIKEIKLIEFNTNGRLGHVVYYLCGNKIQHAIQHSITSCAPVLTGILIEYVIWKVVFNVALPVWSIILLIYVSISVFNHMSMSKEDVKNYCRGLWVLLPVTSIVTTLVLLKI